MQLLLGRRLRLSQIGAIPLMGLHPGCQSQAPGPTVSLGYPPEDLESLNALGPSALHREMVYYSTKVIYLLFFVYFLFLFG